LLPLANFGKRHVPICYAPRKGGKKKKREGGGGVVRQLAPPGEERKVQESEQKLTAVRCASSRGKKKKDGGNRGRGKGESSTHSDPLRVGGVEGGGGRGTADSRGAFPRRGRSLDVLCLFRPSSHFLPTREKGKGKEKGKERRHPLLLYLIQGWKDRTTVPEANLGAVRHLTT